MDASGHVVIFGLVPIFTLCFWFSLCFYEVGVGWPLCREFYYWLIFGLFVLGFMFQDLEGCYFCRLCTSIWMNVGGSFLSLIYLSMYQEKRQR